MASDGRSEQSPETVPLGLDPLLGRAIAGKFVIERLVGEGSMGAVYRAQQVALERAVAIKVMRREVATDPTFAARFHLEAKAASRLDHPNVIRVFDYGQEPDGLLYIAMEFLDCRSLFQVLNDEWPLSHDRLVAILSQTLSALAEAHELGVLHRDLKPENIMLLRRKTEDGTPMELVKVCDFGIAKLTRDPSAPAGCTPEERRLTTGGLVVGTPEYMAPEQARGEAFDSRSDVYAVGVILYQLLTRRLPFEAKTPVQVIFKAMHEDPEPLGAQGPTAAPGLDAICRKAMSRAPEERFQSAREMRAALRAAPPVIDGAVISDGAAVPLSRRETTEPAIRLRAPEPLPLPPRGETTGASTPAAWPRRLLLGAALLVVIGTGSALVRRQSARREIPSSLAAPPEAFGARVSEPPRTAPSEPVPPVTLASVTPSPSPSRSPSETQIPREARRGGALSPPPVEDTPAVLPVASIVSAPSAPASVVALLDASVSTSPTASSLLLEPPARPAPSAGPLPFNRASARVDLGFVRSNNASATTGNVTRALRPFVGRFTACYRDALGRADVGSAEVTAALHLESDESGYVTASRVIGDISPAVKTCIEAASRSARIEVDTGTADVDVTLAFKPR